MGRASVMTPWVPVQDAADVLVRSVKTVRDWARHGAIRSHHDPRTGTTYVHWLDARKVDGERTRRVRRVT